MGGGGGGWWGRGAGGGGGGEGRGGEGRGGEGRDHIKTHRGEAEDEGVFYTILRFAKTPATYADKYRSAIIV